MIDTDVPNYKLKQRGVIIHDDDEGYRAYLRQSKILGQKITENQVLKTEINNIKGELESLKSLVTQLLNKAQ